MAGVHGIPYNQQNRLEPEGIWRSVIQLCSTYIKSLYPTPMGKLATAAGRWGA